jgi:hypothetical protein
MVISILFMIFLLVALKIDIDDKHNHIKQGNGEPFNTKKCKIVKICKSTCRSALSGAITGAVLGGPGGAVAGAFIMGTSGGLVTFIV